ncbi:hypothetical protein NMG60_11013073 [Bertholletia excelsa]
MASLKLLLPCLVLPLALLAVSEERDFLVGNQENGWKIPSFPNDFNKWSSKIRFQIGDSLVLKYDPKADSVLQVSEEDFESCNGSKPIRVYSDGDTKIALDRSGPFYFISGAEGHCEKGQKMVVRVLSPRHGSRIHPSVASISVPPSSAPAPAPSPAALAIPAPAPAGDGCAWKAGRVSLGVAFGSLFGLALVLTV